MGQATLDLPDPLELTGADARPMSPEALASADDLLSQLAGDDIDRLLSEADAERPAYLPIAPVEATPAAAPGAAIVEPISDAVAAAAAEQTIAVEPSISEPSVVESVVVVAPSPIVDPVAEAASTDALIDSILAPAIESAVEAVLAQPAPAADAVFASAEPIVAPLAETEAPKPPIEVLDEKLLGEAAAHVAAIMDVPAAQTPLLETTDAQERQALTEPLEQLDAPSDGPPRFSLLLWLLEWINYPILFISDELRDVMGKVALLTMFNAVAVLIYLMMFRRPHH